MKRVTIIGSLAVGTLLLVALITSAFGQPDPNTQPGQRAGDGQRMRPPQLPPITMKFGAGSLFVLQGLTLAKYDADTVKPAGVVNLVDNIAQPTAPANGAGMRPMRPPLPGLLLIVGEDADANVLIVSGDNFFRLQASDLKVLVKATLPAQPQPQAPADGQGGLGMPPPGNPPDAVGPDGAPGGPAGGPGMMGGPGGGPGMMGGPGMPQAAQPVPELHGNTLYLVRGTQLLALDITTGKVTGKATTPITPAKANANANAK